jgi:hypothetical protein
MKESKFLDLPIRSEDVTQTILDEIYKALGASTQPWYRRFLDPLLSIPINRFAGICVGLDQRIHSDGFTSAAKWTLPFFIEQVFFTGERSIPPQGPLLVISNHPGGVDSVCITVGLNRDDLKIVAYEVPFYRTLPNVSDHFIYATDNKLERMRALRESIRHLQSGCALLLFASATIDPDPAVAEGAEKELEGWSPSIPIILRMVPNVQVVLCIAGGLIAPRYIDHPITKLRREPLDKRRLAEFLQILNQILFKKTFHLRPLIYFSKPIQPDQLRTNNSEESILSNVIDRARNMVRDYKGLYISNNQNS